jgi:site-specific recombinase XerD/ribosomal protein L40E
LKKFFRWLRGTEEYPKEVKWIKPGNVKNNSLPEELLTDEEIKAMAAFAQNQRDKALVLVLYESGCRIGELLTLRIKHVEFDGYGAILLVSGKTGSRRVRIIASAPSLSAWLDSHPFKSNPSAPLWIVLGTRNHHEMMSYGSVSSLLRRLAKRAGVKKGVNPHSFRHSRATHLASKLTEAQLKELFGWVQSSDMAATYVHLSGRDVDNALLKLHGLAQNEKKEEEVLKVKICERCKEKNDPVSNFCRRCATPLNIKIALDLEEKRVEKDEVVAMVTERVYQKLQKLVAEKLNIDVEDVVYEAIKEMKLEEKFKKL